MDMKQIKKIPYGISDYMDFRKGNYYYVDKTEYLGKIESAGKYLFFIRPRRFGKSLLLSMMAAYYDVRHKDRFDELFKGTAVYENPTEEKGKYLVLSLNFSLVETDGNKIERSFVNHVRDLAVDFIQRYNDLLSANSKLDYFSKNIETGTSAADIFSSLMVLTRGANRSLYVIIDEYDNFANTVLTTSGESAYHALTHGEGTLRSFFNMVKGGTTGNDAPVKRLFITGVSPLTMDDVTSGFNIGKNVSLYTGLDRLLGFTENDVKTIIVYYKKYSPILQSIPRLLEMLNQWYGNYRFSGSQGVPLFNSDMVLYFIDHCLQENRVPENLIDRNVRMDYGKLRHLVMMDQDKNKPPTTNGNFSKLKQIIEEGSTLSKISGGFSLKEMTDTHNFESLLFYFGLLSVAGRERDRYRLKIPNETVKRLYYDYIDSAYRETGVFSLDLSKYGNFISDMAYDGKWRPLFAFITGKMAESINLRDLMTAEKAIQTFLNVYLGLSDLFIVHSEKELNKGFSDLILEPFLGRYENIKYSCIIEIKYLKSGAKPDDTRVKSLAADAREQLKKYVMDKKYNKTIARTTLIKLVLVFSGHRLMYMGEA